MAAGRSSWGGAGPGVSGASAKADSRHKPRPSCAEDGVDTLADDTVEYAVLGVSRAISQLGGRARRGVPCSAQSGHAQTWIRWVMASTHGTPERGGAPALDGAAYEPLNMEVQHARVPLGGRHPNRIRRLFQTGIQRVCLPASGCGPPQQPKSHGGPCHRTDVPVPPSPGTRQPRRASSRICDRVASKGEQGERRSRRGLERAGHGPRGSVVEGFTRRSPVTSLG